MGRCLCSRSIRCDIVWCQFCSNWPIGSIQLQSHFVNTDNLILKFIWKDKRSRKSNSEGQIWMTHPPNFRSCCKAIAIKTAWHWQKNRHADQWNRTESPDTNLRNCSHLILTKEQRQFKGERTVLSTYGTE